MNHHIILNGVFHGQQIVLYIKSIKDENIEVVINVQSLSGTDNYKDCKTLPKKQK